MSSPTKGVAWWKSLHPWHKMAVVLSYPGDSGTELSEKLELPSRNAIISVRTRIADRIKNGKSIPTPCIPEEVHGLEIPADAPIHQPPRTTPGRLRKKPKQKKKEPVKLLFLPASEKVTACCTKDCNKTAVPRLPFCPDCARLAYKPMTKQIQALIDAAS